MMMMPYFSEDCEARRNNLNLDFEKSLVSYVTILSGVLSHNRDSRLRLNLYPSLLHIVRKYLHKRLITGRI